MSPQAEAILQQIAQLSLAEQQEIVHVVQVNLHPPAISGRDFVAHLRSWQIEAHELKALQEAITADCETIDTNEW
jgi:hypothetical protein